MIRKIKIGWIRSLAVFIASVALWSLFGTVSWVGFQGCGGGGGGGNSSLSDEEEAVTQSMMTLVLYLAGGSVGAGSLTVKDQATSCANGGSMTLNEDGSITFTNCSFADGQFLNGTIRISGDEDNQSIEFEGFGGQRDDTLFEVNGTIEETHNSDGSITFEFNIESSTTGGGETDETNLSGEIRVEDDFSVTGALRINDLNCNFEGEDLRDFVSAEDTSVMDEVCDDSEPIS